MSAIKSIAIPSAEPITKVHVKARIARWFKHIHELYAQIDEWLKNHAPDARVLHDTRPQLIEPLMVKFRIDGRDVPTYTIVNGPKRIAFVPGEIWLVGANGRVGITTNARHHTLVDVGDEAGADWNLVEATDRKPLRSFDRAAFRALLKEGR